jgi:hypothetical protein
MTYCLDVFHSDSAHPLPYDSSAPVWLSVQVRFDYKMPVGDGAAVHPKQTSGSAFLIVCFAEIADVMASLAKVH